MHFFREHRYELIRTAGTAAAVGKINKSYTWLSPLVGEWMDRLRQYHNVGDTAAMPGAKVVAMVGAHIRSVFTEHRKELKNNVEYCR